ncbi:hypothetical protein [Lysobacter sp. A378]
MLDISRDEWRTSVVAIDKVCVAGGNKSVIARLVTEHGKPGIERA